MGSESLCCQASCVEKVQAGALAVAKCQGRSWLMRIFRFPGCHLGNMPAHCAPTHGLPYAMRRKLQAAAGPFRKMPRAFVARGISSVRQPVGKNYSPLRASALKKCKPPRWRSAKSQGPPWLGNYARWRAEMLKKCWPLRWHSAKCLGNICAHCRFA